jgi:hypothetical protein
MGMQIINNIPQNSGLGDTLYEAFNKVNANFAELVATDDNLQIELDTLDTLINSNTVLNHKHTIAQINGLQEILNSKLDVSTFNTNIIAINASIQALNELIAILVNGGGSGGTIANDITVTLNGGKNFGKYLNGQTIPSKGWTLDQFVNDVTVEYLTPTFSSFAITGQDSLVEVGTEIIGEKPFAFAFTNQTNVKANSVSIIDVTNANTVLLPPSSLTSPKAVTLPSTVKNTATSHSWKIVAQNSLNAFFERTTSVTWGYRRFAGSMSAIPATGNDVRTALLGSSVINTTNAFSFQTGNVNRTFVIAIPTGKNLIKVLNADTNDDLTVLFVLDSINSIQSANGTESPYNVYVATFASPYSSNNNVQVTLS